MRLWLIVFATCLLVFVLDAVVVSAAQEEHPGARLIRENNCIACHQIGVGKPPEKVPKMGPDLAHTGHRVKPGWLMDYLLAPKKLRPASPARMPNFRLTDWEAAAITAYLITHKAPWPKTPAGIKGEERPVGVAELFQRLPAGDAGRGQKLFEQNECAMCHGDTQRTGASDAGKREERGPDLREMAHKLTPMGIVSMLFQPDLVHRKTKMPAFFYDKGEAMDEQAAQQIVDVTTYIRSLEGSDSKTFPGGDAVAGRRIATQLNCAGCHEGLDVPARPQSEVALTLGYRNASPEATRAIIASWIRRPVTIPMHERMHGMGRMPTFGFTPLEGDRITHYLFTIDGPSRPSGGGMMMKRGIRSGMRQMQRWFGQMWDWISR